MKLTEEVIGDKIEVILSWWGANMKDHQEEDRNAYTHNTQEAFGLLFDLFYFIG